MTKIHYARYLNKDVRPELKYKIKCGVDRGVWNRVGVNYGDGYSRTDDINKVTCKKCLAGIKRKKLNNERKEDE